MAQANGKLKNLKTVILTKKIMVGANAYFQNGWGHGRIATHPWIRQWTMPRPMLKKYFTNISSPKLATLKI